ncbi:MAG TPA: hypothetical protein VJN68_04455 [Burkholderiaceae bacterium]|nr:hypothetical protein [Burkholderiaceae bacterium]
MKTYRLAAWPQLRPPFDKIAYRRMLSDMSHRHVSVAQLVDTSGLRRSEVRQFLEMLGSEHLLSEREGVVPDSLFGSLRPLGGWLRRAFVDARS